MTRALLTLGLEDTDHVAFILEAVKDQLLAGGPLTEVLGYIWSDDFQCPGGHYSRKLTWDEDKRKAWYTDITDGSYGLEEDWLPEGVVYVGEKDCPETIEITLESDHDGYGGNPHYYPVADGPCVEALGYDDEGFYQSTILAKWEERARLRNFLEVSTTRARVEENRLARIAQVTKNNIHWAEVKSQRRTAWEQEEFFRLLGGYSLDGWNGEESDGGSITALEAKPRD